MIKIFGVDAGFVVALAFCVPGCSADHKSGMPVYFGSCSVEVNSEPHDAEIMIDGAEAGHGHVKINIPCGEKRVVVKRPGFVPYEHYLPVTERQPLKVTVELERVVPLENLVLSSSLADQVRGAKSFNELYAMKKKAKGDVIESAGGEETEGASADSSAPTAFSTNVEDWR